MRQKKKERKREREREQEPKRDTERHKREEGGREGERESSKLKRKHLYWIYKKLERMSEFRKVTGCKINIQNSTVLLGTDNNQK